MLCFYLTFFCHHNFEYKARRRTATLTGYNTTIPIVCKELLDVLKGRLGLHRYTVLCRVLVRPESVPGRQFPILWRRDDPLLFLLLVRYGQSPKTADAIFIRIVDIRVVIAFRENNFSSIAVQHRPNTQISIGVILHVGPSAVQRVYDVSPAGQGRTQDVEDGVIGVVAWRRKLLVHLRELGATKEYEAWFTPRFGLELLDFDGVVRQIVSDFQ